MTVDDRPEEFTVRNARFAGGTVAAPGIAASPLVDAAITPPGEHLPTAEQGIAPSWASPSVPARTLPARANRLRALGWVLAVVGPMLVTVVARATVAARFTPGAWYLPVVIVAAVLAGYRAALLASFLSTFLLWFGVLEPNVALSLADPSAVGALAGFLGAAGGIGWVVHRLDVVRRSAEESMAARRQSEQQLDYVTDLGAIGIISGVGDRIDRANDAFLSVLGYSPDALADSTLRWPDLLGEDGNDRDWDARRLLEAGASEPTQCELLRRDGSRVPVLVSAVLIGRSPLVWVAFVVDESQRKAAERDARESGALLDTMLRTAPVGIAFVDPEFRFVLLNEQLAEITGWPVEEHLHRKVAEIVPDLADANETVFRQILDTGQPVLGVELSGETKAQAGVKRDWLVNYFPVRDENERSMGISITLVEVTERNRLLAAEHDARQAAEDAVDQAERMQSVTAGLAMAVSEDDVLDAMVAGCLGAFGADACVVSLVDDRANQGDGESTLILRRVEGFEDSVRGELDGLVLAEANIISDTVRLGLPIFLPSADDIRRRFGRLTNWERTAGIEAWASLPLIIDGGSVGGLHLGSRRDHSFSRSQHVFLFTLAGICGQALQRCRLLEAEKEAGAQAEAARATARMAAQLEAAQRIARVGSWEWIEDSASIVWSREMYSIFGLDADHDPIGDVEDPMARIHPDDRDRVLDARTRARTEAQPFLLEHRIVRPDGTGRIAVVVGEPVFDDDDPDVVVGVRGTTQDVTDQRESEEALARTREQLLRTELARQHEHHLVRELQRAVLPDRLPDGAAVEHLEIAAVYTPASADLDVGGDWYDAFVLDEDRLALTIGDVSGHGVEAAALMAQLRNALRAHAFDDPDPALVLTKLNRLLARLDTTYFATAVYAVYDRQRHTLQWSRAGHPPPLRFGSGGAHFVDATGVGGPLLGVWPDATFVSAEMRLDVGEAILLYTDGLVERRRETIDLGLERLRVAVATAEPGPLQALCDGLVELLLAGQPAGDDICQLAIRRFR